MILFGGAGGGAFLAAGCGGVGLGAACGWAGTGLGEAWGGLGAVSSDTTGTETGGFGVGLGAAQGGGTAGFFLIIVPVGDMDPVELWELRRSLPIDIVEEAAELRRRSIEFVGLFVSSNAFFSTCLKKSIIREEEIDVC